MSALQFPTAEVFATLVPPARYKGAWGGRGSGKSHFFAERVIHDSLEQRGLLSVCVREVQKDLKESSKRLIENKLADMGLGESDGFRLYREAISTPGDGVIIFKGMQEYTAEGIKSLEGFGRAWIEEAQTLSAISLNMLRPTIREPGSEIWASWNPRRKKDPVDVMLRGAEIPSGAVVVETNWRDNPWLTPELVQERLDCLRMQPDQYDHIWEGGYVTVAEGAYYAQALAEAKAGRRIGNVSPDKLMRLRAYCDIGGPGAKADAFAMWICQFVGREIRVLNYYEAQGQELSAHVHWLRSQGYNEGSINIYLPHDGAANKGPYSGTWESAFTEAGYDTETIIGSGSGAAGSAAARIEAGRRLFPSIWFNADTTEDGRAALGWYHEKKDEKREMGLGPEHDWSSHGADAFGLMCVAYEAPSEKRKAIPRRDFSGDAGWMNR